jgi:HlyD family type I secretion membrane fusion protein
MVKIITRRLLEPISIGFLTIAIFFGFFGFWVFYTKLDSAVVASGNLVVSGNRITIQHKEGGTIDKVLIRDGVFVERGSIIIELDNHDLLANLRILKTQYYSNLITRARSVAEISDVHEFKFPEFVEYNEDIKYIFDKELIIFQNHRRSLAKQIDILDFRIEQSRFKLDALKKQLYSIREQANIISGQIEITKGLFAKGLETNQRLLDLTRSSQQLNGAAAQVIGDIESTTSQITSADTEKMRIRADVLETVTREALESELRAQDARLKIDALTYTIDKLKIRAPADGWVVNLRVSTSGGTVQPGQPILEIVPSKIPVVAEIKVLTDDIQNVITGGAADIVLLGFSNRTTAPIKGRVLNRSADQLVDQRTGASFFRVEIELIDDQNHGKLIQQLIPGMSIEAVIHINSRTVLDYLISPLMDSIRRVGREM